ncbi:MAG: hypothetical protein KGM96_09195 [Acidobacteriota bacterium]|nr:hypothetical protein [Acidobacteriota bacterium]
MNESEQMPVEMDPPRTQGNKYSGAADLRVAADMVLEESSIEIARALARSSLEGHLQSIKFLYDLAEYHEKRGAAELSRTIRSLAGEWAAEPEWLAEMSEQDAETAGGSREPEG